MEEERKAKLVTCSFSEFQKVIEHYHKINFYPFDIKINYVALYPESIIIVFMESNIPG